MIQSLNSAFRRIPTWPVYLLGLVPFGWLFWLLLTGGLGVDPVKTLELNLGLTGLKFIVVGLAVTPLRRFTGLNLIKFRRALGLLAFAYVLLHLLTWLFLDMHLLWSEIWRDIYKRPYITIGMGAFGLLFPLALTSSNGMIRRLGPLRWRRLHRLVYPAAILAAIHFTLIGKVWTRQSFAYLAVVLLLLLIRVKWPRNWGAVGPSLKDRA